MKRSTAITLQAGEVFKLIVLNLGALAFLIAAIVLLIQGHWVAGLVTLFIVEPVWFFIADIATGLILLPIVGIAALVGKREV